MDFKLGKDDVKEDDTPLLGNVSDLEVVAYLRVRNLGVVVPRSSR
jgi:hypothetical protein